MNRKKLINGGCQLVGVWQKLWGRLCEAEGQEHHGTPVQELNSLWKRFYTPVLTAAEAAEHFQSLLEEA